MMIQARLCVKKARSELNKEGDIYTDFVDRSK